MSVLSHREHGDVRESHARTAAPRARPDELDATFEAVVFDWEGAAGSGGDGAALRARVDALCGCGVHCAVVSAAGADEVDARLASRPRGPGRLLLCAHSGTEVYSAGAHGLRFLGAAPTRSDTIGRARAARAAVGMFATHGITGRLVLAVRGGPRDQWTHDPDLARAVVVSVGPAEVMLGPDPFALGGGPARLLEILDAQLSRHDAARVPQVDDDPRWVLTLAPSRVRVRVDEALSALANGQAGTRGDGVRGVSASPLFAVAGVYDGADQLLHGPIWTDLGSAGSAEPPVRLVDLRTGTLLRLDAAGTRSLRFVSAAVPHAMALRAEATAQAPEPRGALVLPEGAAGRIRGRGASSVASSGSGAAYLAVAAHERRAQSEPSSLERVCAWSAGTARAGTERRARRRLSRASGAGFGALLGAHRGAWARRWDDAVVTIDGNAEARRDEIAARFALFHLLAASSARGEAAVGARALTGDAYGGHVMWDADVFVLPALAALRPAAARAMLEYRVRRLPAARRHAAALGRAGARFPWESARTGDDVTPRLVHGAHGEVIPIRTGPHEEHIVADVAWAAVRYAQWSGDDAFVEGPGKGLVVETARYWASRVRLDPTGRAHLYGLMGPDEYHEVVDDNAFTNVLARWNLERGAELLERTGAGGTSTARAEARRWRALAAALVDGFDPERGIYEQFAGYFGLEPLVVADLARPPIAIDVLLGPARVARSQLLKQADVLMLLHMLPEVAPEGALERCIDFYEPRTAHGSSLSPAISASLLARAGRPDDALELFRTAARIDLDDITQTTAGGLHLATMGGLWQALAYGFLGASVGPEGLVLDPRLPSAWRALTVRFRARGRRVEVRATHEEVTVGCDAPLRIVVSGREVPCGGRAPVAARPGVEPATERRPS